MNNWIDIIGLILADVFVARELAKLVIRMYKELFDDN